MNDPDTQPAGAPVGAGALTPSPDPAPVLLSAGDALTETQTARLAEAVAVLRAARAALDAGVPAEHVALFRWDVVVEPVAAANPAAPDPARVDGRDRGAA